MEYHYGYRVYIPALPVMFWSTPYIQMHSWVFYGMLEGMIGSF